MKSKSVHVFNRLDGTFELNCEYNLFLFIALFWEGLELEYHMVFTICTVCHLSIKRLTFSWRTNCRVILKGKVSCVKYPVIRGLTCWFYWEQIKPSS